MSFTKKYKKFKNDPELFFQDSITKQYSKIYKLTSSIRNSKVGIGKAIISIKNGERNIQLSDGIEEGGQKNISGKISENPKIKKSTPVANKSKDLLSTASVIIDNVKKNVHVDKKKAFKDYFDEVVVFTEQYDVNSLKLDGKNIWPHFRNNLWIHMNFVAIGKNNYKNITSVHIHNSHRIQISQDYRVKAIDKYGAKEVEHLNEKDRADVLFMVALNASEQVHLESGIYHRVCDPFYEAASKIATTKKIELIKSASPAISRNKDFIHPATLILPPVIEKLGYSEKLEFDKKIFSSMKQFMPSLNTLDTKSLKEIFDYDMNMKDFYTEIFKKVKPKVVFFYAFHYNAPMIEAADELGIITVDIQHGLQVGWNPLYTNYDEMPPEGYRQIPDFFAVWGEKEYQSILNSFPSEKHRPIYMGNPWLEKIKTFPTTLSKDILDELESDKYDKKILIIMQNQTYIPQTFIDIIEQTKNDNILWIVRHHPKGERYKAKDFSIINQKIILSDEIDTVLFSELFKYVDITISEGSTLAIEASYFGVTNIVTSAMGADNYKQELKDNVFYYLENSADFHEIMKDINNNQSFVDTSYLFKKVNIEGVIRQLLDSSNEKQSKLIAEDINKVTKNRQLKNKIEAEISAQIEKSFYLVDHYNIDDAIASFKEIKSLLTLLPTAKGNYNDEEMRNIKEARVFQRKIKDEFNIDSSSEDVFLVGDSLALPRPLETRNINYGMTRSYAYMFNKNNYGFKLLPWAQRNLNTSKLLKQWGNIGSKLNNKHLVIQLGNNDYQKNIFSEMQLAAVSSLSIELRKRVYEFDELYRKEIINSQDDFNNVEFSQFKKNIESIAKLALESNVKSLTFISIIAASQSSEINSPSSVKDYERYNSVIKTVSEKSSIVRFLDINELLNNIKKHSGLLSDNLHLSIPGHQALASAIFSKLSIENDENKTYRVALIGVGNQGIKHLQGLAKSHNNLVIECFEPNQTNIQIAMNEFKAYVNNNKIVLRFVNSREGLSDKLDLVIVATNSNIRTQIVEELLNTKIVKNLILETILFQDTLSYHKVESLIEEKGVKVWVNHSKRMNDIHHKFIKKIRKSKNISFQVSGVNWSIGNRALDFLDLFSWMTNTEQKDIEIEWNRIGRDITQIKGSKIKEVFGTISGSLNKDVNFSITSLKPSNGEVQLPTITIVSETIKLFIDEYNSVINYAFSNDDWQWHKLEGEFPIPLQSEITSKCVDDILEEGRCLLPSFATVLSLHLSFTKAIEEGIEHIESRGV